jgi:hypothetical protein
MLIGFRMDGYLGEGLAWGLVLGLKGVPAPYAFEPGTWEEGDIVLEEKVVLGSDGTFFRGKGLFPFGSAIPALSYNGYGPSDGTLTLSSVLYSM